MTKNDIFSAVILTVGLATLALVVYATVEMFQEFETHSQLTEQEDVIIPADSIETYNPQETIDASELKDAKL